MAERSLLLDRLKVAGISVEGERLADGRFVVVIGIGVNCRRPPGSRRRIHPASDFDERGVPLDAEALFERLAHRMADELDALGSRRGLRAPSAASGSPARPGIGEPIRVNLPERTIDGRFDSARRRPDASC